MTHDLPNLIRAACKHHGVFITRFHDHRTRSPRKLLDARAAYVIIARDDYGLGWAEIADKGGWYAHSSVSELYASATARSADNKTFAAGLGKIRADAAAMGGDK